MWKRPKINFADFPQSLIEKEWGLTYLPPKPEQTEDELREQASQIYNTLPGSQEILQTDQIILAAAFGQIKIMGTLDAGLKKLAFLSLDRMERLYRLLWDWKEVEAAYNIAIMRRDLTRFVNGGP